MLWLGMSIAHEETVLEGRSIRKVKTSDLFLLSLLFLSVYKL